MMDAQFINILACPKCKSGLEQISQSLKCLNANCRLEYRVNKGIPIMLISEAVNLHHQEEIVRN